VESAPTETLTHACPESYDPNQEYFPDKVSLDYAQGFSVEYHNHYKVVTVTQPWKNADTQFQYLLVQCGTPPPSGYDQAQVIEVPVQRVVALSTTHLPHFDLLKSVDALAGVDQFQRVNTPSVRRKIDQGALEQFTVGQTLDLERLVAAQPDLVMAFATSPADTEAHGRLRQAGIPVVVVAEYLEATPLAQAEWLKFTALFLNQEAQAQDTFAAIAQEYEALVDLAASVTERPTVFTGSSYNGTWYVPGGESHVPKLLRDAGADYLWADVPQAGSLPLDFEAVYDRAATADFWVNLDANWQTRQDALADDPRYGQFQAWQADRVFNNNRRTNGQGGNDYWESGIVNPHRVLADLIAIFHPDLLPDHELLYYQPLEP
jgi:iron complex transport system substrate-binding protein